MRMVRGRAVSEPLKFQGMSWIGWTVAATALGDNQMSFTRRKFVLGMGTVIFFTGSASSLLANTRQEKEVRYAMIHDESRCNGCNICARACRKTNHVPAQGSRLSIAHIPVIDNDNGTQYHFFVSHVSTAKMLLASTFARQGRRGVMSRDRAGRKIAVHRLQLLHWRLPVPGSLP